MTYYVYWIHEPWETDILTEGYVGITNNFERRMNEHGDKFGGVKEIVEDNHTYESACDKEAELRPKWYVGKNIAPGGQAGNRPKGIRTSGWKHSEEGKRNKSKALIGNTNGVYGAVETEFDGITFRSKYEAEAYRKEKYGDARKNNGGQNKRQVIIDGKTFSMKKEAINYLVSKYGFGKNKAIEYIDQDTPIEELLIKRRKKGS